MALTVDIISPERKLFSGTATAVQLPGTEVLGLSLSGVFNDVALELKSRESVTLTVVDAA